MLAHLEPTENDGRERIAVMGASTDEPATIIADDGCKGSNPRLVLVAPGIISDDAARTDRQHCRRRTPRRWSPAGSRRWPRT